MEIPRRRVLTGIGGAAVLAGAAGAGGFVIARAGHDDPPRPSDTYPFYGSLQAGILTPAQDRMHFASFDLDPRTSRDGLIALLRDWTAAAARLTQGLEAGSIGATAGNYDAPPDDTGEAIGLPASGLTITFGFGPTLFADTEGKDRFGLASRRPEALQRLPHFPADKLDPASSDGDLCVQACANDPQVAVHAIRNLTRIAMGRAPLRWSQLGFGRTSSTSVTQDTPRNLFGFKDGTASIRAEESDMVAKHVLVPPSGNAATSWLDGGSYLVARKIAMNIESWDRTSLREQESIFGRTKGSGAPLSGGEEFTELDFALPGREGKPIIEADAHVALAHPVNNDGVHMLRRGYNYVDGSSRIGRLGAGLFFITFVCDPRTHYIPMQMRMSSQDLLQEYIQHVGSGLYAIPPGVAEGGFVGQALFDS